MENKVYQMVTDRIIEQMQKGIIPWRKPWHLAQTEGIKSKIVPGEKVEVESDGKRKQQNSFGAKIRRFYGVSHLG